MEGKIKIKRIGINRVEEFVNVLKEIALWLRENKKEMWNISRLNEERFLTKHKDAEYYICYVNDDIAGAFMLLEENNRWWPNVTKGESLFFKKFGVRRKYAGKGISSYVMDWVKNIAQERKYKFIRIEFIGDIDYLYKFYEKCGFTFVKEVVMPNGKRIVLYEQKIE